MTSPWNPFRFAQIGFLIFVSAIVLKWISRAKRASSIERDRSDKQRERYLDAIDTRHVRPAHALAQAPPEPPIVLNISDLEFEASMSIYDIEIRPRHHHH